MICATVAAVHQTVFGADKVRQKIGRTGLTRNLYRSFGIC